MALNSRLSFTLLSKDKDNATNRDWDEDGSQPAKKRGQVNLSASSSNGNNSKDIAALNRELNLLKVAANTAMKARILASALMWSIMVPYQLIEPAVQTGKDFVEKYKGGSNHKAGSPHVRVWKTLIQTILISVSNKIESLVVGEDDALSNNLKSAATLIQEYYNTMISQGPKKAINFIRQCRVKQCRDTEKGIIHYQISHLCDYRSVDVALHFLMENLNAEILEGTEPPSEIERKLQKDIEAVQMLLK